MITLGSPRRWWLLGDRWRGPTDITRVFERGYLGAVDWMLSNAGAPATSYPELPLTTWQADSTALWACRALLLARWQG